MIEDRLLSDKDKIQEAIKSAREKNKGKIAPATDIYEAIYRAGYQQGTDDTIKSRIVATAASEPWYNEETVFEDGKKAGAKEVVDWIRGSDHVADFYYSFDQVELHDKLKEWGL